MKSLHEGIKEYKLELIFYGEEIEKFREILKEAQEHYALWSFEEDERPDSDSVVFRIYCSTTSFANAYYYLGTMVGKHIISERICKCKVNHRKEDKFCIYCKRPIHEKDWAWKTKKN